MGTLLLLTTCQHGSLFSLCMIVSPPGVGLNDGQWHSVSLFAKRNYLSVTVDGQVASAAPSMGPEHIYSGGSYYFGGKRSSPSIWATELYLQLLSLCLDVIVF